MVPYFEEDIYLTFTLTPGIGPLTFLELKNHFRDVKQAFTANENEIAQVIGSVSARQFAQTRSKIDPGGLIDQYRRQNITLITQKNPLFPKLLLQISDSPICLFALQKNRNPQIDLGTMRFAIVGSRRCTPYGKMVTYSLVSELSRAGVTILSGLALSIDAMAHQAALDAGGATIGVLGSGVDIVYPPDNRGLRQRMIDTGNTLISEYPPGVEPTRGSFVARNRIVSGISRGVLIVEGTDRSGSLITAKCAANQGRDVFAVPGPITSPTSQAPLILLKQGAKLVTMGEDILSEYSLSNGYTASSSDTLPDEERNILALIMTEPQYADDIGLRLGWSIVQVMNILSLMEVKGLVEKDSGGRYYVTHCS